MAKQLAAFWLGVSAILGVAMAAVPMANFLDAYPRVAMPTNVLPCVAADDPGRAF
jgi:hypothetical protein